MSLCPSPASASAVLNPSLRSMVSKSYAGNRGARTLSFPRNLPRDCFFNPGSGLWKVAFHVWQVVDTKEFDAVSFGTGQIGVNIRH